MPEDMTLILNKKEAEWLRYCIFDSLALRMNGQPNREEIMDWYRGVCDILVQLDQYTYSEDSA